MAPCLHVERIKVDLKDSLHRSRNHGYQLSPQRRDVPPQIGILTAELREMVMSPVCDFLVDWVIRAEYQRRFRNL